MRKTKMDEVRNVGPGLVDLSLAPSRFRLAPTKKARVKHGSTGKTLWRWFLRKLGRKKII